MDLTAILTKIARYDDHMYMYFYRWVLKILCHLASASCLVLNVRILYRGRHSAAKSGITC